MDERIKEKLMKLKALADRGGTSDERETAEAMLYRLLDKYNIYEEDLLDEVRSEHEFRYWGMFGKDLFTQVVYSILPDESILKYVHKRNCSIRFINCTEAEAIQIKETFEFYRNHLDAGLKNYYKAFVQVEKIFPQNGPVKEMSRDEYLEWINSDTYKLMNGMDKHDRHLMIEEGVS